jgi:phosphatidylserine decarboxylase
VTAPHRAAYIDRRTGTLRQDPIWSPRLLGWAYDTRPGWLLTRLVLSRPWVSRLYGWLNARPRSRQKIPTFVRRMGVDLDECVKRVNEFESFNDFIVREIDLSRRWIDPDPATCVAPVDGRMRAYPAIDAELLLTVKRTQLDLRSLVRRERLAATFAGGSLVVSRLHLSDYHHFHFPAEGTPRTAVGIRGRLFAVTPYSARRCVPYFTENSRMVTEFDADRFGEMLMIEVGAFSIGSIQQRYVPGRHVDRGAHKGFFQLGASVVMLLFRAGAIRLASDICANTERGVDTYVRLGEPIGRA